MDSGSTAKEKAALGAAWGRFLDYCESVVYGFFKWAFVAGFIAFMLACVVGAFALHWAIGIIALLVCAGVTAAYFGK